MAEDQQQQQAESPQVRKGGDRRAAAAANGSRIGRPPSLARKAIAEAKKLTQQRQEEAVAQAIAKAEALGADGAMATAVGLLEATLALHAEEVASLLLAVARGVVVQEESKDGPRIYSTPPNVQALIYIGNRVAGAPISKIQLVDWAEKVKAVRPAPVVPTREAMLVDALNMIYDKLREKWGDVIDMPPRPENPQLESGSVAKEEAV